MSRNDVLDSRDLQERIDALEDIEERDDDEQEELDNLIAFKDEVSDSEWDSGLQLIDEDYFEEYAQELAQDIGAIGRDAQWPLNCIDWEQAAEELKGDYRTADYNGNTYYFRAS